MSYGEQSRQEEQNRYEKPNRQEEQSGYGEQSHQEEQNRYEKPNRQEEQSGYGEQSYQEEQKECQEQHKYDDMIHLPHHVSASHPQMPLLDRAAQFAPFAALTGYDTAVKEAAQLADTFGALDEGCREQKK